MAQAEPVRLARRACTAQRAVGPAGPSGPPGPVTMTRAQQTYDVPAHGVSPIQAGCPSTSAVTGGGYYASNLYTSLVVSVDVPPSGVEARTIHH